VIITLEQKVRGQAGKVDICLSCAITTYTVFFADLNVVMVDCDFRSVKIS